MVLREYLLSSILTYARTTNGEWVAVVESLIRGSLEARTAQRIVTEQAVAWDELPAAVRREWLRNQTVEGRVDLRTERDRELQLVSLGSA